MVWICQNINWINDFPYVNSYILKNIQKVDLQNSDSFPLPSLFDFQDEIKFGQELFDYVIANYDNLKLKIEGRTPNWDSDRIAKIDYVILITAIAELIYFNVAAYQRSLIANHNKTEWDNKIDEVVKSNSREKRI